MLIVSDILENIDVLGVDREAATEFGSTSGERIADKRRIAVDDWLAAQLQARGLPPHQHVSRLAPNKVLRVTASSIADVATAVSNRAAGEYLDLDTVLATPGTDSVYVGSKFQYRGLYFAMFGAAVNSNPSSAASITYWNGTKWAAANSIVNGTYVSSIAFGGGGVVRWQVPDDWQARPLDTTSESSPSADADWLYWTRIQMDKRPSAPTRIHQLLPIRRSRLTLPAAYYALHLLYAEAAGASRPEWMAKSDIMAKKAYTAFERAVGLVRDEFDIDNEGNAGPAEASSVVPDHSDYYWERG